MKANKAHLDTVIGIGPDVDKNGVVRMNGKIQ